MKKTLIPVLRVATIMTFLLLLTSCRKKEAASPAPLYDSRTENLTEGQKQTYHTDSSYKYEYRTGTSGDYQYDYDVSGTDENGGEVTGNVSMRGKSGNGTITTNEGTEIEIDAEWTGKGTLSGTDSEGNTYDLEVD